MNYGGEIDWDKYVSMIIQIIYDNPNEQLPISPDTLMLSGEIVYAAHVKYEFFESRSFYKDPIRQNLFALYTSILYAGARVLLIPTSDVCDRTIHKKFKLFMTKRCTKLTKPNLVEALMRIQFHLDGRLAPLQPTVREI